jgi:hypothetical protein
MSDQLFHLEIPRTKAVLAAQVLPACGTHLSLWMPLSHILPPRIVSVKQRKESGSMLASILGVIR